MEAELTFMTRAGKIMSAADCAAVQSRSPSPSLYDWMQSDEGRQSVADFAPRARRPGDACSPANFYIDVSDIFVPPEPAAALPEAADAPPEPAAALPDILA